ncbi:hypothetical protein CesoFtcFv8_012053 [Champsocephalus esox]|uniref:Uncharacterized protein n=1 Tax=Champsocephalus esox TaxID=159716 RepID=A0AAN8GXW7_9TELE|nr:hypothetical protein CesoFtcFv8_012053 [Champsocephalus esox]
MVTCHCFSAAAPHGTKALWIDEGERGVGSGWSKTCTRSSSALWKPEWGPASAQRDCGGTESAGWRYGEGELLDGD